MSPLKIEDGALCLSGTTGSKLKTEIVGKYIDFWQGVTSGGKKGRFRTFIIDMNAGVGRLKIEDTNEIVLGSAGHILNLRYGNDGLKNKELRIGLIEPDQDCRKWLLNNIKKYWPAAKMRPIRDEYYVSEDGHTIVFYCFLAIKSISFFVYKSR